MTIDGYCTVNEFSKSVPHHFTTIKGWIKDGKMQLPDDRKMHQGDEVVHAKKLMRAYEQYIAKVQAAKASKEEQQYAFRPKKNRRTNEPIVLPEIMLEAEMAPYRQLGWAMLIEALLDLASPSKSDKRNSTDEQRELTTARAKRWLLGESDPAMLSLVCQLSGVSESWVKEKVHSVKSYPSRTEMKRMLSEWRAYVGARKQTCDLPAQTGGCIEFAGDDLSELAPAGTHLEPVYAGPPTYKRKRTQAGTAAVKEHAA